MKTYPNNQYNPYPGDLVEGAHPDKGDFVFFGIVHSFAQVPDNDDYPMDSIFDSEQLYVQWQKPGVDGELERFTLPEYGMVKKRDVILLAKAHDDIDACAYNWWKAQAISCAVAFDDIRKCWALNKNFQYYIIYFHWSNFPFLFYTFDRI